MSVLGQIADFVVSAEAESLPRDQQDMLRRHVTDVVLARYAGARAAEGKTLASLQDSDASSLSAIAGMAASVRLTEIDDIHIGSCTTVSSVSVPVGLALAANGTADPKRVMGAILAGTELVVRIGKAIDGARVLYQGIWPTRVGAPLGAAAVACRMWGLDRKATEHALSLALMMTPARIGRIAGSPSGRWVLFMAAINDGLQAAEAARAGFTGDPALLDGPWLEKMLGVPVDMDVLMGELGNGSVYPELSMKPYCTSRQALSATEAIRQLVADGLDPATIKAVKVRVPNAYAGMISMRLDPQVHASSYVSAGGMMAIAALAPKHLADIDRSGIINDPRIKALADKVSVEADSGLDSLFPRQWAAEIEVETTSGIKRCRVVDATGDPGKRLDDAGWQAKAEGVLAHYGMERRAAELLQLGRSAMSDAGACTQLARLFTAAKLP